jgi:sodium-coupled monocarboxylate transporter 8/12
VIPNRYVTFNLGFPRIQLFQALVTKIFSFLFGLLAYSLTFVIRFIPGMMEAAIVIGGVVNGPILGVFTIGMLLPWVNSTGVLVGFVGSLLTTVWIATGGTVYKHYNPYVSRTSPPYPSNISGCPAEWLEDYQPEITSPPSSLAGHIPLYDISYIWYTTIGAGLIVVLSLITSLFTSEDLRMLDRKLLAPVLPKLWSWMPKSLTFWIDEWWYYIGIDLPKPEMEMKKRANMDNIE